MAVTAPPRPPGRGEPLEREEIEALVEALIEEARQRAQRRRRRNAAVVSLVALVGVALFAMLGRSAQSQTATSSALSAPSSPSGAETHPGERNNFAIEGKRGSFSVRMLSTRPNQPTSYEVVRTWRLVLEPLPWSDISSTVALPPTGQYVQVTGRGKVVRIGGHKQGWSARLEGFVTRPGEAKQRVVITMKGRPEGVLLLTPLKPES